MHGLNAIQHAGDLRETVVNVGFIHESQHAGGFLWIEVVSCMVNVVAAGDDKRVAVDNLFQSNVSSSNSNHCLLSFKSVR